MTQMVMKFYVDELEQQRFGQNPRLAKLFRQESIEFP